MVAGEASGDLLGAGLIEALRERYPDAQFAGVGGPRMCAAGFDAWWDCSALAVMGLVEVVRHLPRLLALRRDLLARTLAWRPDVFIGIDAPDFNLGLERRLKQRGLRTVHYVSPSVWAWREARAARIGRSAQRVLCLFPMEPAIYARHGVDARFVGHPLADSFALQPDRHAARRTLGVPHDVPVLALLPGSRLGEIARLGRVFLDAARRIAAQLPGLLVLAPMANEACRAAMLALDPTLNDSDSPVRLIDGEAHQAMIAADVVLLASGTAALEGMLAKRPLVVGYRIAALTYWIVRTFGLMRIDRYSLPNVLAGEVLASELMQDECTADALASAVLRWFRDPDAVAALQPRYLEIHQQLRRDASRSATAAIAELLPTIAPRQPTDA
jgi:lipid-A-disaccharide synthase